MVTTTTFPNWKTGDVINICAAINEFCGTSGNFIFANDINVSASPNACTIQFGTQGTCSLHLNNVELTFQLVEGFEGSVAEQSCLPIKVFKTLGNKITDSNGVAGLQYTVTDQDRLDFESVAGSGDQYVIMACITNPDGQATFGGKTSVVTRNSITISPLVPACLCMEPICLNNILYEAKCDASGNCVADTTKLIASPCPTNYLDLIGTPWPWYDPKGGAVALAEKLTEINGAILNFFAWTGITDYTYVASRIFPKGDKIIVRVYVNSTGIASMAGQLLLVAGVLCVTVGVIGLFVMQILNYFWGTTDKGLNNQQLTDAGVAYSIHQMDDCATAICIGATLTQDQKAECIDNCVRSIIKNWTNYQTTLYPNGGHPSLDAALTTEQTCYNTYTASSKTATDYQTYLDCSKGKRDAAIKADQGDTLQHYPPAAAAGATSVTKCNYSVAGQCLDGIITIGEVVLGAYIVIKVVQLVKK